MESDPDPAIAIAGMFLSVSMDPVVIINLILFLVLLVCSGLLSSSEVAFFSITVTDLEGLKDERSASANRILKLLDKPATLLATILISNNFVNVSIIVVSEFILRSLLPIATCIGWADWILLSLGDLGVSPDGLGRALHFGLSVVGVTMILVLMGEILPKIYARFNVIPLARTMSRSLLILARLFRPFTAIMVNWTDVLEKRLARHRMDEGPSSTEINSAIELTVTDGQHSVKEVDILKRIVQFADVTAKQIMRPRTDIVSVDQEATFAELLHVVRESGYSRIPVYEEDLDHILGVIYTKDLINYLQESEDFDWQPLVRTEVLYVPESKKINDLLKEFQTERRHIGIVVDEYGGTAGLVTLEDIMEEIVGEIKDEFDDEEEVNYQKLDERNYLFDGKTLINDVCRIIGVDTSTFDDVRNDADSLAGLVLEMAGMIPRRDTVVETNGFFFRVTKVNKRRVEEIKLTLPEPV
ncbi:MAG: gliding motility-associated protein GldE [Saprospiraceae bacterium]